MVLVEVGIMAIKPDDCVIKIKDLEIGFKTESDIYGSGKFAVYEPYWNNFCQHVKDTTDYKLGWDAYDKHFVKELKKFNAICKNTKNWDDRYIKFKKHSDLTFFILRWS